MTILSRKINSTKNLATGLGSEILSILLKFITRTVFIQYLGLNYLGINGLFTNVLSVLSLVELDFSVAITYNLYKPIKDNDQLRILQYMDLYKRIYRVVGIIVIIIGVAMIPFLPYLIKDYDRLASLNINAVFIFLLYLFESASSYFFFAYKATIVRAHQKEYRQHLINYVVTTIACVLQIIALIFLQDFIVYTVISLGAVVVKNLLYARQASKMYPFINNKVTEKLPLHDVKALIKDSFALFIYKINRVIINATDNIVLSAFIGLSIVGAYSNYLLIVTTTKNLLKRFYQAIAASLGNLHASGNFKHERRVFDAVNLITFWLYGLGAVGIAVLADEFIYTWIGPESVINQWVYNGQVFATPVAVLIGIELYLVGLQTLLSRFRNAMGLFQQAKYRPIAGIIINLVISVVTAPMLGVAGVVLGTIVSSLLTFMWFDPFIIFKHGFAQPVAPYYLTNLYFAAVVVVAGFAAYWVCGMIPGHGWGLLLVRALICVAISGVLFLAASFWRKDFKFLLNSAKSMLKHARKK